MVFFKSYVNKYQKGLINWTSMDKPTLLIIIDISGIIILSLFFYYYYYIWIIILLYLIGISVLLLHLIRETYDGINYYYGFERKIFNCPPIKIKNEIEDLFKKEKLKYIKNDHVDFFNKSFIRTIYSLKNYNLKIILNNVFGMICINSEKNQKISEILKEKIDKKLKKYEYSQYDLLI